MTEMGIIYRSIIAETNHIERMKRCLLQSFIMGFRNVLPPRKTEETVNSNQVEDDIFLQLHLVLKKRKERNKLNFSLA